MAQRMCRELRVVDPDRTQTQLNDAADRVAHDTIVAVDAMRDEQRRSHCELTIGNIFFEPLHRLRMENHRVVFRQVPFALHIEDGLALTQIEVPNIDTLDLARAQPVEQH